MTRKIYKAIAALSCAVMLSIPAPVFAAENTPQPIEVTESATAEGTGEMGPSDKVTAMIAVIDTEDPDAAMVTEARSAYDALSMAQKMQVEGYENLTAAEAKLGVDSVSTESGQQQNNNAPDTGSKSGKTYTFYISDYTPQVTVMVRYQTDADGDGKMDSPNISMTSPSGTQFEIPEGATALEDEEYKLELVSTPSYTQIDVAFAKNGTWTVNTSNLVLFTLSDYSGDTPAQEFKGEKIEPVTIEEPKNNSLLVLGGVAAALAAAFILIKKMPSGKQQGGKKKEEEGPDIPRRMSEEEEIEAIRREWESQKSMYDDPVQEPEPKKEQVGDEDERLFTSQEDIDPDDGVEILDDDSAFFGNRFL